MKSLYEAINLGGIEVRNRFVRSATHEGMSPEGNITPALIDVYHTLAKNKVGLIITSGIEVTEDIVFPNSMRISEDSYIESLKAITSAVHKENGKVIAQLLYGGSFIFIEPHYQPLGPSAIEDRVTKITPKEMTNEDIDTLVANFADAAYRSKEAGFDGVQIQGSAGFIFNKFLSPHFNRREDAYGGSIENRARILVEIREAIASKCGKEYPVFIKVSVDDMMKEDAKGLDFSEGKKISKHLASKGYDAIEACGGMVGEIQLTPDYNDGKPYLKAEYNELAKDLDVPLIAIGGIRNEFEAHELINTDNVEAVAFSRPFIADTDLVSRMKNDGESRCVTCFQCSGPDGIRCIKNI